MAEKVLIYNVKTGEKKIVEMDIQLPTVPPEEPPVDFKLLRKLIQHAKSQGWI